SEEVDDVSLVGLNVDDLVLRYKPSNGQMLMYKRAASGLVQVETYLSPINKVPVGSTVEQGNVWIRDGYTQNGSNYFGTRFVLKRYASLTQVWNIVPAYTGNSFQEVEAKSGVLNNSYIACRFDDDSKSFSFYI
ncbi:hypothetical protein, partial [Escherichia coli]